MKTYTIKTPIAELMIIEPPQSWGLVIGEEALLIYDHTKKTFGKTHTFKGSYTLLGKHNEIREEDAIGLVSDFDAFRVSENGSGSYNYKESLLSLIESEIYWDVNPEGKFPRYAFDENVNPIDIKARAYHHKWNEAEKKTFDRSRSIILVKQ